MKDQETVQRFIELRSTGVSFVRLAEQLGVAKSTLINWSREHQHLIQNLRAIEWEDFVDRTLASRQERLKAVSEQLRRLEAELARRDLASPPPPGSRAWPNNCAGASIANAARPASAPASNSPATMKPAPPSWSGMGDNLHLAATPFAAPSPTDGGPGPPNPQIS
jgi:hypothetical protein